VAAGDYAPTGHGLLLGQALRPAVSAFNVMLACIILSGIRKFPFIFLLVMLQMYNNLRKKFLVFTFILRRRVKISQ
jgi:hypothetical protein